MILFQLPLIYTFTRKIMMEAAVVSLVINTMYLLP